MRVLIVPYFEQETGEATGVRSAVLDNVPAVYARFRYHNSRRDCAANNSRSFFPNPCTAWLVTETGQFLEGKWEALASVTRPRELGQRLVCHSDDAGTDDRRAVSGGEVSRAWVNAASEEGKAEPEAGWQRSLMRH